MIPLREYRDDPIICPYCKSDKIVKYAPEEPDLDFVVRRVQCTKCKKGWSEIYELMQIEEDLTANRRIDAMRTRKEMGWDKNDSQV